MGTTWSINNSFARYGFAFAVTCGAYLLTQFTVPVIKSDAFDFFQGAVVLSAWYGGLGPGILAAGLSIVAMDYFFLPPFNAFAYTLTDILRLGIFAVVAVLSSSLSARLKKAKADLQHAHEQLEVRIAQRTEELSQANIQLRQENQQRTEAEQAIMEISNREQRRLGQDLHDGLSQILAGVKLMTERIKKEFSDRALPGSDKLSLIESHLSSALTHVDTISRGLYPVELETNGLMAALNELADKISNAYAVRCRFKCQSPVVLKDSAVANHVYRIAQEAVYNAIKGGKADKIHLGLSYRGDQVLLKVADNGLGLRNGPSRKGMGMKLMEYRTRVINGTLKFRSRARGTTLVSCSFPI